MRDRGRLPDRAPERWCSAGARIEAGAEVEFHAVVYVNTVVPSGVAVPMGWFAGGQPAELVAPGDWERIRAIMGPLDDPGTVSRMPPATRARGCPTWPSGSWTGGPGMHYRVITLPLVAPPGHPAAPAAMAEGQRETCHAV